MPFLFRSIVMTNDKYKNIFEKSSNSLTHLVWYVAAYSSASILGPLLVFGAVGFFLDWYFDTKPIILILSILVAFITTNFLLYKKIRSLNKEFEKHFQKKQKEQKENQEKELKENNNKSE